MKKIFLVALLTVTTVSNLYFVEKAFTEEGYKQSQDATIKTFEELLALIESDQLADTAQKISLSDKQLHYLNGVYLFCSLKNGTCPMVLRAVLELDIINSQQDGVEACPNMLRFWKGWVDNGLEQRIDYSLNTGFLTKYFDFKKDVRPKYLKCSSTVKEQLSPNTEYSKFIKERYGKDTDPHKNINTVIQYLKAIREQIDDVFISTGAYKRESKESVK